MTRWFCFNFQVTLYWFYVSVLNLWFSYLGRAAFWPRPRFRVSDWRLWRGPAAVCGLLPDGLRRRRPRVPRVFLLIHGLLVGLRGCSNRLCGSLRVQLGLFGVRGGRPAWAGTRWPGRRDAFTVYNWRLCAHWWPGFAARRTRLTAHWGTRLAPRRRTRLSPRRWTGFTSCRGSGFAADRRAWAAARGGTGGAARHLLLRVLEEVVHLLVALDGPGIPPQLRDLVL